MTKSNAKMILEKIRKSQPDPYGIMKIVNPEPEEIKIAKIHLSADGFQEFKKKFILEYNGEPVQPDGLTHPEFLTYFATGRRENDEFSGRHRLEAFLRRLDNENPSL